MQISNDTNFVKYPLNEKEFNARWSTYTYEITITRTQEEKLNSL